MHPETYEANLWGSNSSRAIQVSNRDFSLLKREAKRMDATVEKYYNSPHISITVTAPPGQRWANNEATTLQAETERTDPNFMHEVVQDLIDRMREGYCLTHALQTLHEDTCECEECENAPEYPDDPSSYEGSLDFEEPEY